MRFATLSLEAKYEFNDVRRNISFDWRYHDLFKELYIPKC
jgi:hypothetical protein